MKILLTTLADQLIKALYLTLVHSLWQGLLLAALAAVIVLSTRKSAPAKRYNLLVAALALFTLTGFITFVKMLGQASSYPGHTLFAGHLKVAELYSLLDSTARDADYKGSFLAMLAAFFNKNAGNIVLVWFLVICFRSLKLLLGLDTLYRLKHTNLHKTDIALQHKVMELAAKMGITRAVRLAVSGIAKVPMVIGHLKPLILLPAGLITLLPPAEIEAILIHELAHIRRRDYMVNMLQSVVEIVYFFNPAVWWLSSLIRTEREHCCDEIAVMHTSSKKNYIKALVSCEEYHVAPAYALALSGHKNHLMNRIKRIVSNNNPSLNRYEKIILTLCLVTAALLTAAVTHNFRNNRSIAHYQRRAAQATKPLLVPQSTGRINQSASLIATEAEPVPSAGQSGSIAEPLPATEPKATAEAQRVAEVQRGNAEEQKEMADRSRYVADVHPVAAIKQCVQQGEWNTQPGQLALQGGLTVLAAPSVSVAAAAALVVQPSATDDIIAGLEQEGIIKPDAKQLSFTLNNKVFVVDGVRQPAKIFLKYHAQYVAITGTTGRWEVEYKRR